MGLSTPDIGNFLGARAIAVILIQSLLFAPLQLWFGTIGELHHSHRLCRLIGLLGLYRLMINFFPLGVVLLGMSSTLQGTPLWAAFIGALACLS